MILKSKILKIEMINIDGLKTDIIGTVGGDTVKVNYVELSLEKVKDIYFNTFARTIEQDL